jgi:hypothetical protein
VGATIVAGHDLDIRVARPALAVLGLDAGVGEVYMLVEVRQVVLGRPSRDLFGLTIRVDPVETLVLD